MSTYLIRFGSNSNWEEIELDDTGVRVAKRSGYDVVPIDGSGGVVHAKNDGDGGIIMKSIAKGMIESPVWWGCRDCEYEAEVLKVPMPDDGLCLKCRERIYNNTSHGIS